MADTLKDLLQDMSSEESPNSLNSLLSDLRAEKGAEVSSPLLQAGALPSPQTIPQYTPEQLKTMEYEGLAAPRATPSPFITAPVEGPAALVPDIGEAIAHLGKGLVALPAVGLESLAKMSGALLGGASIDEALMEAEKAGAWLGPGPQTTAAGVMGKIAGLPHEITTEAVGEPTLDIMSSWAKAHGERIRVAKKTAGRPIEEPLIPKDVMQEVDAATKAIFGTAIELGLYTLIGSTIRSVMPKGKPRPNVQEIEAAAKKLEVRLRKGGYRVPPGRLSLEGQALSTDIMKEMGLEPPTEPTIIRKPGPRPPGDEGGVAAPIPTEPVAPGEAPVVAPGVLKAEFKGYQETAVGAQVPYYNVGKDTMTVEGLARRGIPVPETPPPPTVKDIPIQSSGESLDALSDVAGDYKPLTSGKPRSVGVSADVIIVREGEGLISVAKQVEIEKLRAFERKAPEEITPKERAELEQFGERMREAAKEPKPEEVFPAPEKRTVTMAEVEAEAKQIVANSKDLNDAYKKLQELTTRYESNLDAGFADSIEHGRYVEWGDDLLDKVNVARKKAGLIEEPPPEEVISIVTPEGNKLSYTDPTDKGGFSTRKAAEIYRQVEDTLGDVIENPNAPGQFVFRKAEGEALSSGGVYEFQKLYEKFVERFKKSKGDRIDPGVKEILDRGEIVQQRKVRGLLRPPVYGAELEVLKSTKKLEKGLFNRGFENPIRTFEEAGGSPLLDLTTHPYHAREHGVVLLKESLKKSRTELFKELSREERKRVGIYAIAKQKNGGRLLKASGVKEVPELTPKEMNVYNALRDRYEAWYTRLNRMRKAIGKEGFPKTDDYFTFIRNFTTLERAGFHPFSMSPEILDAQFIKMTATPFRFAKARTRALYKVELDPFRVLDIYEDLAARHIQMSPLVAKLRELQVGIKDPETGKVFRLTQENPVLAAALHSWTNHIAGMRSPAFNIKVPWIENAMMRVNSNLAASVLGANLRSAMIQVSALRNTVAEIGPTYAAHGTLGLLDPGTRAFHLRNSKVLKSRSYDVTVEEALRGIRAGKIGQVQRLGAKIAMKPLQILDYESALATRIGAYEFALRKLKYSKARAATYADDVLVKTQASALPGDIAPVQRSVTGKFFTLFQTFTINDWDFLVKDVIGVKKGGLFTGKQFKKAMSYVAATTLFNSLFEDVLHINTPFPNPIKAFRESLERGDELPSLAWNVGSEFIEPIPIIGAARYGKGPGGPGAELLDNSIKFIKQDPLAPAWWELSGKWLGVPGTAQAAKMVKAEKRGETTYGQIVGTYTPKKPKRTIESIRRKKGLRSP